MSDLISREALLEKIKRYQMDIVSKATAMKVIRDAPTVEAKPVVHGEWKFNHFYGEWECSECGSLIALSDDESGHANFCPNCGADMRKKV